jgi:hypothetical protein
MKNATSTTNSVAQNIIVTKAARKQLAADVKVLQAQYRAAKEVERAEKAKLQEDENAKRILNKEARLAKKALRDVERKIYEAVRAIDNEELASRNKELSTAGKQMCMELVQQEAARLIVLVNERLVVLASIAKFAEMQG